MTAIIEHLPGGLPVVKATLGEWKNAGKFTWEKGAENSTRQWACQSKTEAEILAHAINSAYLNQPKRDEVAA